MIFPRYVLFSLILGILLPFYGNAQDVDLEPLSEEALEAYVLEIPEDVAQEMGTLHAYLSKQSEDPSTLVRLFFLWIVNNIEYDEAATLFIDVSPKATSIAQVLKRKQAICTGYAGLMRELCERSGIPCKVIDGYTKSSSGSKAKMNQADHAWNAIKLKEQWHLLDATWAAGIHQNNSGFRVENLDYYYLAEAGKMLKTHLPADPMWQLIDCPISLEEFRGEAKSIDSLLAERMPCFALLDSLKNYEQLSRQMQRVKSLERAYQFNPTKANSIELGHIFMDQFIEKAEQEEDLQFSGDMDALLQLYPQLFALAAKAEKYTTLYDWQKENLAYVHINFGVALSRKLARIADDQSAKKVLLEMETSFLKGQSLLQSLPTTTKVQQGLDSCEEYLSFTRENLKND